MDDKILAKKNLIAQWAFDTRPVLMRFHLWLEDVEVTWLRGERKAEFTSDLSFVDGRSERQLALSAAVTALGTRLFGRFGEGAGKDKRGLNQVKKDADAVSAYVLSESLWNLSRLLPENHAIMVSLGEGLMPKAGETPEMGSNPQLGFGRVYARPQVARWVDERVAKLINSPTYGWDDFYRDYKEAGITIWGAAIDTLENTSRFAKGAETGSMTVLHLFDQPLQVTRPYEGYMGNLFLPKKVVEQAAERSVLIDFRTPRSRVVEAIKDAYPGIKPGNIHVWTLRGKSREERIGSLWKQWQDAGVHVVEDGWTLPNGKQAFAESGTYAPTYLIGSWTDDDGEPHLFLCDGYAASAEAVQAATLARMLDLDASLAIFTSRFKLDWRREQKVMHMDPEANDFADQLGALVTRPPSADKIELYRNMIREAAEADLPLEKAVVSADDFFPEKRWDALAVLGYMSPDPYSGAEGVEEAGDGAYRVTVRMATTRGDKMITFTLRLMEDMEESHLVFNPLLVRFMRGEDFHARPVRISDSGRIRNELQTLCSEALDYFGDNIRICFDRIPTDMFSREEQTLLLEVLQWYLDHHPMWFGWLEIIPPGSACQYEGKS
jgi:hypothetical protein